MRSTFSPAASANRGRAAAATPSAAEVCRNRRRLNVNLAICFVSLAGLIFGFFVARCYSDRRARQTPEIASGEAGVTEGRGRRLDLGDPPVGGERQLDRALEQEIGARRRQIGIVQRAGEAG